MNETKLNKILNNHKLWLKTDGEEGEQANLSLADLRGADLKEADLRGANLREADLSLANLREADLSLANLSLANLREADLKEADLRGADLDYSSMPLSCKGLDVHIDDRLAIQHLYHLVRNVRFSKNTSTGMKELCMLEAIVKKANEFHRVGECGEIKGGVI